MAYVHAKAPNGMVLVSQEQFFAYLKLDKRDIMPNHDAEEFTMWQTRNRDVVGWSTPGWKAKGLDVFAQAYALTEAAAKHVTQE